MDLQGVEEFKALAQRLRTFQQNKEKYSISEVTLPNYLWIAKRGGGISTCNNAFAEYLYNARMIEFTGVVKYFEYKLAYIEPESFFSELTRLNNTISEVAGHHRFFRGLAGINIDQWINRTDEQYFNQFLDYIASKNDKILTILYVHTDSKRVIENIESSLSSYIRFESIRFRFPNANELVNFLDTKYFKCHEFYLAEDAKLLLTDSIESIINSKHFNGFATIKQLAKDILYSLLTSDISRREISAELLASFTKESSYVRRIKTLGGTERTIGFDLPMGEHLR